METLNVDRAKRAQPHQWWNVRCPVCYLDYRERLTSNVAMVNTSHCKCTRKCKRENGTPNRISPTTQEAHVPALSR